MFRWLWSGLLRRIARNRAVALALLSAFSSILIGAAITYRDTAQTGGGGGTGLPPVVTVGIIAVAVALMILAGAVPEEYAAAERFDLLLPAIHRVLGLEKGDRIAVHRLHKFPSLGYEQITDYYDGPTDPADQKRVKHTVGRRYSISHGIVAQSLSHPGHPIAWAIPEGQDFNDAMMDRWFFTEEEAKRIASDRQSFLAFPIGRDGEYAKAVLYADSSKAKTFGGSAGQTAIREIDDVFGRTLENALKG